MEIRDPYRAMPQLKARILLVMVLWLQLDSANAFTVQSLHLLPSLRARVRSHSCVLTLASKKAKSGSSASKTPRSPRGFGVAARSSPTRQQEKTLGTGAEVNTHSGEDFVTLYQIGEIFSDVRERYRNTTTNMTCIPQDVVRRNLQRLDSLPLNRCNVRPSTVSNAGQGLFASRDIEEGELITCYPGDAVFEWEDADHSPGRHMEVHLDSKHVVASQESAERFVKELRTYEVPASPTLSVVGDPLLCGDSAYLGHIANDGACPDFSSTSDQEMVSGDVLFSEQQDKLEEAYHTASSARANAEHISLEGCHAVTRALKFIPAGEEVFVTYGYGYWLSSHRKDLQEAKEAEGST